ncbi:hypothetical protein CKO42_24145 [Lamprobacter modestohalophilus]|uniref:Uncharacterized protein n=1 Tax=Lamprobacter modestohalophilus TaxID=1064514 RepID=A0A9X0WDK5_9GAMM|nr:hypothetical protein [Lamprobacter modestohalophilus]
MHSQNFKNLILDYPREAIAFFAAAEAWAIDAGACILPIPRSQSILIEHLIEHLFLLDAVIPTGAVT